MAENFKEREEQINTIINVNALLMLLTEKNIIKDYEFRGMKQKALEDFKNEFPQLFKEI